MIDNSPMRFGRSDLDTNVRNDPARDKAWAAMRRALSILILIVFETVSLGTGWNDFEQPLGDGYSIVRANTREVVLIHNGSVITGNDPLIEFVATPTHFFTKHVQADGTHNYYVVQKHPETVIGPLTENAFSANDVVVSAGALHWRQATNPHHEPAGNRQRQVLAYLLISLILALPIILFVWNISRDRRRRTAADEARIG